MQVNREEFLHQLESIQPGLSPRETIEQSSCVVVKDGRMYSFNEEIACSYETKLDFEGAVAAAPLIGILRKYTEEVVEVEATKAELLIRGKRGRRSGVRLEQEIALPIDTVEQPGEWRRLPEGFVEAVELCQQCAGKDESNFNLTCVHITPRWVEACDNFQITRFRMKTGVTEPTLVRRDSIRHIGNLGVAEFSETPTWLHYRNAAGLVISCRRYVEEFPDLEAFLTVEGTKVSLPKGLQEVAEAAQVFSSENADSNQVLVQLRPGKALVKGQGVTGWHQQPVKVNYQGEPMDFLISPAILTEIVKNHNECVIAPERLMVDNGRFKYVSCLSRPAENGEA